MKLLTGWIITLCFFTAIVGGFFVLKSVTSGAPQDFALGTTYFSACHEQCGGIATDPSRVLEDFKEYHNKQFGFSVSYPQDLPPKEYTTPDPNELTVAFQAEQGGEGFQIYIAPVDGNKITQERFLRDEASGVRKDPHDTAVDGVEALAFHGFDAAIGQTSEVWFIKDGFLYEVSSYKELEPWFTEILKTWRFI